MEEMQKALDAHTKDIDKAKTDADFKALEKKHEKELDTISKKMDDEIQGEMDAVTKGIEDQIEKDRKEEEEKRKNSGIVYTTKHTVKEMRIVAKERGIAGYSRMKEDDLISALNKR